MSDITARSTALNTDVHVYWHINICFYLIVLLCKQQFKQRDCIPCVYCIHNLFISFTITHHFCLPFQNKFIHDCLRFALLSLPPVQTWSALMFSTFLLSPRAASFSGNGCLTKTTGSYSRSSNFIVKLFYNLRCPAFILLFARRGLLGTSGHSINLWQKC